MIEAPTYRIKRLTTFWQRLLRATAAIASVSLLACGSGGGKDKPDTEACGTIGLKPKIINGTRCAAGDSPLVAIVINNRSGQGLCTGTMITPTTVLTAAHCFFDVTGGGVVAGGASFSLRSPIARTALHPNLVRNPNGDVQNDVAIVTLRSPLPLPTLPVWGSRKAESGDIVGIFGFGRDGTGDYGNLTSGEMLVSSVSSGEFDAFFDGTTGSNTCFGDSGGPALYSGDNASGDFSVGVLGITSSGTTESCASGDVSSFTDVTTPIIQDFIIANAPGVQVR
jgi:secreted trypsin-like serine protease